MKLKKIKSFVQKIPYRQIFSLQSLSALIITVVIVAVTLSSSEVMVRNYELEKQVAELEQRVNIAQGEADKQRLENQYYATDAYLDIAARRQLTKGLPGEKLVIVPKSVALSYVPKIEMPAVEETNLKKTDTTPVEDWLNFLSGKGLPEKRTE